MRSVAPGLMLARIASETDASLRAISLPSSVRVLTDIARLPALNAMNPAPPAGLDMSPSGDSNLITSAPRSARRRPATGPAMTLVISMIRTPERGRAVASGECVGSRLRGNDGDCRGGAA